MTSTTLGDDDGIIFIYHPKHCALTIAKLSYDTIFMRRHKIDVILTKYVLDTADINDNALKMDVKA